MSRRFDLFERAAACASLLKLASDPIEQQKLLANDQMNPSPQALADEAELENIQSRLGICARATVH